MIDLYREESIHSNDAKEKGKKMVGIFSRFSVNRTGHRRSQTVLDQGMEEEDRHSSGTTAAGILTSPSTTSSALMAVHGLEVAVEFKPLDRPIEPVNNDRPIQCPFLEPCILNDGRIWKQRIAVGAGRRSGPGGGQTEPETAETKPRRRVQSRRESGPTGILPSISAPEGTIIKLLDECNAS